MDEKTCTNCSQLYVKVVSQNSKRNIPLFLSCGHSMCENCVTNIIKFGEPIQCRVCQRDMEIDPNIVAEIASCKNKLFKYFPINMYLVGELASQEILGETQSKISNTNNYIDLKALIESTDKTQGQCAECNSVTTKMCVQCAMKLCDACFNKSHKNFVIFKSHVLQNIEPSVEPKYCKNHKGKSLDYYCNDCSKSICMDCFMIGGEKSCKKHNVVSMDEVNESFKEELKDTVKSVDTKFRRLTKTAVDVGNILQNIENKAGASSELTQMMTNIEQNFSKLLYAVQKHKMEITDIIKKLKNSEFQSLLKAKDDIAKCLKTAKVVMNNINSALNPKNPVETNLAVLLDEAKMIVNAPWYLIRDENADELKMAVDEDLCSLVNDYIHLEGNASCVYKLCADSELPENVTSLPPPPKPVYPPELPKDVRQKNESKSDQRSTCSSKESMPTFFKEAPKYRSKSGSVTSLNSDDSHSSHASNRNPFGFGDLYPSQSPVVQQVQPFAESKHPKQLHEGCQELIFISHIVNPHNFFVQRACHQNLVKELLKEFRNASHLPKPSLSHVTEGKTYLVFNKADNMWQRCRVVSIDRSDTNALKFHVFCIDFGSTETVNVDNLRLLPPARVQSPFPLAIHCSLANCKPKSKTWTSEDSFLIQKIIDNKRAIIYVRSIRSTSNFMVTLECDVTTFDEGVSLAHALVFHDRAVLINPKLPYPKIAASMERPKLFISHNDLPIEEVFITHIVSPDMFYVRKRHFQDVYEKLNGDLEEEYSVAVNSGSIYLPEVGMLCVANVEQHSATNNVGSWQRAVVTELTGRGRARVRLPDAGPVLTLHVTQLRHIHQKFCSLAALAKECYLAGVTPPNKKWSAGSVALLEKFQNRLLELHIEDQRRGSIGVVLYDKADKDNIVCVNSEMITYNFAVTFGMYSFNKKDVKKPNSNQGPSGDKQRKENIKILQRNHQKQKSNKKVEVLKKEHALKKEDEDELDAKDKGPLRLEAKLLDYQSPSQFYVSLEYQQKVFSELYEKLQKYYSKNTPPSKVDWAVGNKCCCLCQQSQTWRRAVIQEIEGENAKIYYSDFACTETVPLSALRKLTPEFTKVGDAAIKCHICGVISASGDEWPSITKEYLKELLDAYPRIFITKLGDFKDKSMPVELWVYHTIEGGALEANRSEWRCLNKKIIEQGLGIPDKTQPMSTCENESNTTDDMLSFLKNVAGSVDDYLQLDQAPAASDVFSVKSEENSAITEESDIDTSSAVLITDWQPSEILQNKEFTGMPTYIDLDGVIFLHDLMQIDTLDLIRKALDMRFNKHKKRHNNWTVGEPCIARFCLDNRFYRGRIVKVNDDKTCLVHYVDYGNEELCSFDDLRKNIALYEIPIQAHKCILARIQPLEGQWNRQTLDYIHKTIVEKNCFVKVLGEPVDGITPIDLKIDKLWISNHLVEFDMAKFADGSKPVIRKFITNNRAHSLEEEAHSLEEESDSGPDYIVEDENEENRSSAGSPNITDEANELVGKDWIQIMEEDDKPIQGIFVEFPKFDAEEFKCNITVINNQFELELNILHDETTSKAYEQMYEEIEQGIEDRPPLNGIYRYKACVAIFNQDKKWYRAIILEYSDSKVKVKYVDYGNVDVVKVNEVKEIHQDWLKLPPANLTAANVEGNPSKLNLKELKLVLNHTYIDKGPFNAKIVKYVNSIPHVRLTDENGELVFPRLLDSGGMKDEVTG